MNAPKHKFGANLNYRNMNAGFNSNLRLRFVDSFPANSGIFIGTVDRYTILDLNATYTLPFFDNTRLNLTVQNLLNNKHREFVGLPELGRLAPNLCLGAFNAISEKPSSLLKKSRLIKE